MAKIIQFPIARAEQKSKTARTMKGTTAEIIIFPGIRFERHDAEMALVK